MAVVKITQTPELNENIKILQEYYSEKTKSWAIKKAVKDTAMVAKYKAIFKN